MHAAVDTIGYGILYWMFSRLEAVNYNSLTLRNARDGLKSIRHICCIY
jgi:hypothetical protein